MKPEQRFINLQSSGVTIETRDDGKTSTIVGYGAVFYRADNPGTQYRFDIWGQPIVERVMPGAFDRAVRSSDVLGLFNHDPDNLLGRTSSGTMRLTVDTVGLRYEIDIPNSDIGKRVAEAIQRRDLTGSSFSFLPAKDGQRFIDGDFNGEKVAFRELTDLDIFDTGPVSMPAYTATSAGLRYVMDATEGRAAFDDWRKTKDKAAYHRCLTMTEARMKEIQNNA